MAASATSKLVVSDFASSVSHIPSNYVRPISDHPNLSEIKTSGDSIPLTDLQELHGKPSPSLNQTQPLPPPPSPSLNQIQPLSPPPSLSLNQTQPPSPSLIQTQPPFSPPPSLSLNQTQPPLSPPPPQLSSSLNQQSNPFLNLAPPHPLNLSNHVPDPHRMDLLSWTAIGYCFTACLGFNTIFAQVANPSNVSFRIKLLSRLLYAALYLLIAANGIFARTRPKMAFVMDRVGSVIVLITSTIAVPTIPEYVSIGLAVFIIIVYAHQHFYS